jgi:hypothetical protein
VQWLRIAVDLDSGGADGSERPEIEDEWADVSLRILLFDRFLGELQSEERILGN